MTKQHLKLLELLGGVHELKSTEDLCWLAPRGSQDWGFLTLGLLTEERLRRAEPAPFMTIHRGTKNSVIISKYPRKGSP